MALENTYYIRTFGCQMNEHDSETMAGMLDTLGYTEAGTVSEAKIMIINTCSVRDNADKSFFGSLGQLKKYKIQEPERIVVVGGCMMQQDHLLDEVNKKYPWVDIVFGTHNIHELPQLIEETIRDRLDRDQLARDQSAGGRSAGERPRQQIRVLTKREGIVENLPSKRGNPYKALVDIMYGCNNFCSYCIVPYTRGREISRDESEIIREVKGLVESGVMEIMLLGQNVNSYLPSFSALIGKLAGIEGLKRIRFMTSHPKDISDQLIEAFKKYDNLSPYIHLPVQSGSDRILKLMNRGYERDYYLSLIKKLRKAVPDIAISTDIIVGFPGETEKDFQDTLDLVDEVGYDSAFTFLYSKRKGTPAEGFEGQVDDIVKHERFQRLVEAVNRMALMKNEAYLNRVVEVLAEGLSKRNKETYQGRTDTFKLVNFKGKPEDQGKLLKLKITGANTFSLKGEIIR